MAHYTVYVECSSEALEEGGYLAHVPALLGCTARGKSKEEAIERVRASIDEVLALLRLEGLAAPPLDEPIELDFVETEDATYPADRAALDGSTMAEVERLAAASRRELVKLLESLPPEALEWRPDEETWPIHWIAAHVAGADLWYASRLRDSGLAEILWRLAATRTLVLDQLRRLPGEDRDRTTRHGREEWTPRKVARRMVEHEREHTAQIAEIAERYASRAAE